MRNVHPLVKSAAALLVLLTAACAEEAVPLPDETYSFAPPVFDIAAATDGSILVAQGANVLEIRQGEVSQLAEVPLANPEICAEEFGGCINGLEVIGPGNVLLTTGGLDLAEGAGLWQLREGSVALVADIAAFEHEHNPDATAGLRWKDEQCEVAGGFSAGPQSNPYHLTALSSTEVLIGDAAGNSVLWATTEGEVDWVAVPNPPLGEDGEPLVWITLEDGTDCYVQPVPTAVAIGPDGAYYVSELTGVTAGNIFEGEPSPGLSRVWRIALGTRQAICPSEACQETIAGLTSIIDLEFGPDGRLYVVEYDQNDWFAATELENPAGGTIKRCDVGTGTCDTLEDGLPFPGAITFDPWGNLWVVESNILEPTVRRIDLP